MRIFLAGATGVIGRSLVPLLVGQGHQVTALSRSVSAGEWLREQGANTTTADVFDADALTRSVRAAAPEAVIHQLTDLRAGSSASNARMRRAGTRNLVDAALAAGARRIVAQSISWAYAPGQDPASEDEPLDLEAGEPRQTTVGGVAALERAAREMPEWVVLRYGTLYGPGTWYAPDGMTADKARDGELTADADVSSFVHVEDAAAAAAQALAWPSGFVNICDDEPAAGHDWVPRYCEVVGAAAPRRDSAERKGWARGADAHYARKHLGWAPAHPSWREGFASM